MGIDLNLKSVGMADVLKHGNNYNYLANASDPNKQEKMRKTNS